MLQKTAVGKALLISLVIVLLSAPGSVVFAGSNVWTSIGPDGGKVLSLAVNHEVDQDRLRRNRPWRCTRARTVAQAGA